MQHRILFAAAIAAVVAGCRSYDTVAPPTDPPAAEASAASHHGQEPRAGLPLQDLARVKAAASRYHDIRKAIAAGYQDIGVVLPNMGRHFLKDGLLDASFDADHPELLVYTPDSAKLVAVEYAVPISLSPKAPEGFPGEADQWVQFGGTLWTLHAWVWKDNPDGVFNPTNSRVP